MAYSFKIQSVYKTYIESTNVRDNFCRGVEHFISSRHSRNSNSIRKSGNLIFNSLLLNGPQELMVHRYHVHNRNSCVYQGISERGQNCNKNQKNHFLFKLHPVEKQSCCLSALCQKISNEQQGLKVNNFNKTIKSICRTIFKF